MDTGVGAMKVLVIGGSGFLGTELVRQATAAGWETAAPPRQPRHPAACTHPAAWRPGVPPRPLQRAA
ncbi:hypothetical protein GTW98_34320 [Streptomyces sp. SID8375]|nr:hypothetical protein [Streptomyces sp. SID8375]